MGVGGMTRRGSLVVAFLFCFLSLVRQQVVLLGSYYREGSDNGDNDNTSFSSWTARLHKLLSDTNTTLLFGTTTMTSPGDNNNINNSTPPLRRSLTLDIITIGSHTRPDYYQAQMATLGTHAAVRKVYAFTEQNDTEAVCNTDLTEQHVQAIVGHCQQRTRNYPWLRQRRNMYARWQWLQKKSNPAGWVCAQKRPMDALYAVVSKYHTDLDMPDYVILMDDDTWVNLPAVIDTLESEYPAAAGVAVAGCLVRTPMQSQNFTFGWGGYANLFSKPVLQRWMTPINCTNVHYSNLTLHDLNRDDAALFEAQVCARLAQNLIGERPLFEQGMSVLELMHRYTFAHPYVNVSTSWRGTPGFCFHSDWFPSYWVNLYYLSRRVHRTSDRLQEVPQERTAAYLDSNIYYADQPHGECQNIGAAKCSPATAHFCHNIGPADMHALHKATTMKNGTDTAK